MSEATSVRRQILTTAARLFFTQGYTQTGINQLIDESGVAKRTFYRHFESKETLAEIYVDEGAAQWLASLRQAAEAAASPRSPVEVVRAIFDHVEAFARATQFRGCGMLNMAAEFADAGSGVRARVRAHKLAQRDLVRELLVDVDEDLADQINVLIEGAIAGAAALLDVTPIRAAARAAESLVPKNTKLARKKEAR